MNNINSIKYSDHKDISIDDARIVSNWIAEENKNNPHMINVDEQIIFACAKEYGCMLARDTKGNLIGFIKLSQLDKEAGVYERGSLFVANNFRGIGIARNLIESLTTRYKNLAILSITNVPAIIKINSGHSEQVELLRNSIPNKLLQIIEGPMPLSSSDKTFANHTLMRKIKSGTFDTFGFEQIYAAQFSDYLSYGI